MSKPQLFCFPYAGGNKDFFNIIEKDLVNFDLVKPEYSGHGERRKEPYYKDFDELADDMFSMLKKTVKGYYALFGYSMGSITLVEVLKRIIAEGMKLPAHVFLAAHGPHTKSELLGFADNELDEWVKNRTVKFGAVPEKLLNNNAFWRTYLPLFRADYTIIGKYKFEKLDLKTNISASVFYSETDTPKSEIELWKKYFVGECEFYQYSGNHFFIQEHHTEMAEIINMKLEQRYDV